MPEHFAAAAALLPPNLERAALAQPLPRRGACEELRLRVGQRPALRLPEGERPFSDAPLTGADLAAVLEKATGASLHAYGEQLRRGFVCAPGGVRVGVCGTAVCAEGDLRAIRGVSSLCLRVARQIPGAGAAILPELRGKSVLIVSAPGGGKTTFLRELVRDQSDAGVRVALADERGELAGLTPEGAPGFNIGRCTDVLAAAPKAAAALLLLRGMGPEVVAMDELGDEADAAAVTALIGSGVRVFATAHAADQSALRRRPVLRGLVERGAFDALVRIRGAGAQRVYEVETL